MATVQQTQAATHTPQPQQAIPAPQPAAQPIYKDWASI